VLQHDGILTLRDLMMVQWRTETCRPNSNKVYEDIYFVVLMVLSIYYNFHTTAASCKPDT